MKASRAGGATVAGSLGLRVIRARKPGKLRTLLMEVIAWLKRL